MVHIDRVIADIRSKLGDTKSENYKYSNSEIINALNNGLTEISQDSLAFGRIWLFELKECVTRYENPKDFIKFVDKKTVVENDNSLIVEQDTQTFFIDEHIFKIKKRLKLYYYYHETIYDGETILRINSGFGLALIYFALSQLFMTPNRENGLQMSEFFYNKYKDALILPMHHTKIATTKKNLKRSYRRV
jgi:hypothetical protein